MTKVRLEDIAEACGQRLLREGQQLPLDVAKNSVRAWFDDIESEFGPRLAAEHASPEQRDQFLDAFHALQASVTGMLQAVAIARPQPHSSDPYASQVRDREYGQQGDQRGGNALDAIGGAMNRIIFGPPPRTAPTAPRVVPVLVVNTSAVYQQVVAACRLLDRMLAAAEPREEAPPVPWAQSGEFLVEAQKLFGARIRDQGQHALDELDLLEERLKARYGVEVIRADDSNRQFFTLYPNETPGDTTFKTKTPAISVQGRVMLRGEALGPAMTPPAGPQLIDPAQQSGSAGYEGAGDGEGGWADGY
jgi:hypothetical protein